MSIQQYDAYRATFGTKPAIKDTPNRRVKGVGGHSVSIGLVTIQVPFVDLDLILGIDFLFVTDKIPTLIYMFYIIENGLDMSLQRAVVTSGRKEQALRFENYFLIHQWSPEDITYGLYSEHELRRIHRNFGHPSVTAT